MRVPFGAAAVQRAAALIRDGRLVSFPTETVYGLGARADDGAAVRSIFAAKGRPSGNPLIVHVPSMEAARSLSAEWPHAAEVLARAFWPGPLTLIVLRRDQGLGHIAPEVTAFGSTVAVRVPAHPVALALLEAAGVPIAAPSANRSTGISPTTADHVVKSLGDRVDLVLDGGPTGLRDGPFALWGIESTIVDVTASPCVLLRHGAIPIAAIAERVPIRDAGGHTVTKEERALAPGSQVRHYAPSARVAVVPPDEVCREVLRRRNQGERCGALEREPGSVMGGPKVELPADAAGYAAGLYEALHQLEDLGCDSIVIAAPPEEPGWEAVRDRIRRASAPA